MVPQAPPGIDLAKILETYSGNTLLWFANKHPGWQLDRSEFSIFADFSADERKLMTHRPRNISLVLQDDIEAAWNEMEQLRQDSLQHKKELDLPVIERDHTRLHDTWPKQLKLARVFLDDKIIASLLWTEHDDKAALVELAGNKQFRHDEIAPRVVFELLTLLHRRGMQVLLATRYEWFFPAIWSELLTKLTTDAQRLQHQQKSWAHLHNRGMRELNA